MEEFIMWGLDLAAQWWPMASESAVVGMTLLAWRRISAFGHKTQECLERIEKNGVPVHIKGRSDGA